MAKTWGKQKQRISWEGHAWRHYHNDIRAAFDQRKTPRSRQRSNTLVVSIQRKHQDRICNLFKDDALFCCCAYVLRFSRWFEKLWFLQDGIQKFKLKVFLRFCAVCNQWQKIGCNCAFFHSHWLWALIWKENGTHCSIFKAYKIYFCSIISKKMCC